MLRVELINQSEGKLVINDVDPGGLAEFEIEIKRSKENDGVFYEFGLNLDFNKAARSFVRTVYENEGIEGTIKVNLYQYLPNAYKWTLIYTGQLQLSGYKLTELAATANLEQIGFERRFLSLSDRDVNLEATESYSGDAIPQISLLDLTYPSKTILKRIDVSPVDEQYFQQDGLFFETFPACATPGGCQRTRNWTAYGNINTGDATARELLESFTLPWGFSEIAAIDFYRATEAGIADIDISLNLQHYVQAVRDGSDFDVVGCGNADLGNLLIQAWFKHEDDQGNVKTLTQIGTDWNIPPCPGFSNYTSSFELKTYQDNNVQIEVGDRLFCYYTVNISATYEQPFAAGATDISHNIGVNVVKQDTFIKVNSKTTFQETTAKTVLVYEALEKVCQFLTGQTDCFRSDFFGRTDTTPTYPTDGNGSLLGITNGRALRGLPEQDIFVNWDEFFQTLNSLYCLGWGFEKIDDFTQVIRVEPKEYFYNKNLKVFDFGDVSELSKEIERDRYFGNIEAGYPRIEKINQANGVDEFNSIRRYSLPITQIKGKLDVRSVYRASGFEIESQRRLRENSEESKLDDENFLIKLRRDGLDFIVDRNEDFANITGVIDPDTVYNAKITPRRNIENWEKVLAGLVLRNADKVLKFSYGQLNYTVETQLNSEPGLLGENSDLDLAGVDALYYPEAYEFETKVNYSDFEQIRANPRGYFVFNDWVGNQIEGYLLSCKYRPNENKGLIRLLRIFRQTN